MEDYKELSGEQFGAITRGISLGRTLQRDHPEIAVMYGYHPQTQIPEMLDIQSRYDVSDNVAVSGVRFAVTGHNGGFGVEAYEGLMDEEEREWIGRIHNEQSCRKVGRKIYEQGIGIHGRTAEQHSEDVRKATIAKGQTPWSDEEKEFAYMLSLEQEYQHPNGTNRGQCNNQLIALELNIQYHDCNEVRSTNAVKKQLFHYRKSLVDIVV